MKIIKKNVFLVKKIGNSQKNCKCIKILYCPENVKK